VTGVRAVLLIVGIGMAFAAYLPGCRDLLPAAVGIGLLGAGLPVLAGLGAD
jgi:hypothetical protein